MRSASYDHHHTKEERRNPLLLELLTSYAFSHLKHKQTYHFCLSG